MIRRSTGKERRNRPEAESFRPLFSQKWEKMKEMRKLETKLC